MITAAKKLPLERNLLVITFQWFTVIPHHSVSRKVPKAISVNRTAGLSNVQHAAEIHIVRTELIL